MRQKKFWFRMSGILAVLAMALILPAGAAAASKYKVLHRFKGPAGGQTPAAGLIFDPAGNLYGTTDEGGITKVGNTKCPGYGCGVVFELTPNADGSWSESVLYRFKGGSDGNEPLASLVFDGAGNLYGTTGMGGDLNCLPPSGCGVVFKLKPNLDGTWTESVLHRFSGSDGAIPRAGLILDAGGNLYGTTQVGGRSVSPCSYGCGTIFRLKPNSDGSWSESVLYRFTDGTDGGLPIAGLILDAAGNLYGTTPMGGNLACHSSGGTLGCGVIFKLTSNSDGTWTESVLYTFARSGGGGITPSAGLIFDGAGNLYGTADEGSHKNCGTRFGPGCGVAFELKPNSDGSWTESVLYRFAQAGDYSGLIFDAAGNLYGTTDIGGPYGDGEVFELMPTSTGWRERVLHVFVGNPATYPLGGLILDKTGNLYGTTLGCASSSNCYLGGVVFEITP
jgi:uncharacterized repeat protein (TIGR03803 family)